MTFWGTYWPVLVALLTWSVIMEAYQVALDFIQSRRHAKRRAEFHERLEGLMDQETQGKLPPGSVGHFLHSMGYPTSLPIPYSNGSFPMTVSGNLSKPQEHGQYL